jgi:hypothetical protein
MNAETTARCWADTWSRAWPQRDTEAIADSSDESLSS